MNVAYIVLGIDGAMCTSGTISMWCHVQVVLCKFHAYVYMYVCMLLFDKVVRNHPCEGMIAYTS